MNFLRRLELQEKKDLTARVSMLLKSRSSLTCFLACFLPSQAKDVSAPRGTGKNLKENFTSLNLVKHNL